MTILLDVIHARGYEKTVLNFLGQQGDIKGKTFFLEGDPRPAGKPIEYLAPGNPPFFATQKAIYGMIPLAEEIEKQGGKVVFVDDFEAIKRRHEILSKYPGELQRSMGLHFPKELLPKEPKPVSPEDKLEIDMTAHTRNKTIVEETKRRIKVGEIPDYCIYGAAHAMYMRPRFRRFSNHQICPKNMKYLELRLRQAVQIELERFNKIERQKRNQQFWDSLKQKADKVAAVFRASTWKRK